MLSGSAAQAQAQTVPAAGGSGAPRVNDEPRARPVADQEASPSWYLKGRLLAGATWGSVATIDKNLGTQYKLSPFIRWNSRRRGWGPSFGLAFTTTDLRVPVMGRPIVVGSVKTRPVMLGIGYSVVRRRIRTTVGMVGGYSFNDVTVDRVLPGDAVANVTIENAWVVQPKVGVTVAATRRLAVVASLGYVFSPPHVSVTVTQGGQQTFRASDHVRVDSVTLRVGAAVSLF
jgi:hypothetical protein